MSNSTPQKFRFGVCSGQWGARHGGQTDGQTTIDIRTALCTVVHRAVKTQQTQRMSYTDLKRQWGGRNFIHCASVVSGSVKRRCS